MRNPWRWWIATALLLAAGWIVFPNRIVPPTMLQAATESDEDDEDKPKDKYSTELKTPLVGDYTNFAGLEPTPLEGVGLVVGLPGTGGDPAPSMYRTTMLEELKRRNVPNPNRLLESPDTALVIVRAYLPPLLKKGEALDVEVIAPESAEVTSLAGGWLLETYLTEQAFVPGRGMLKGHNYAKAEGPIMVAGIAMTNSGKPSDPNKAALLQRGRILGGATVLKERELVMQLRHEFRSVRNSARIATAIGQRFHDFDEHGIKKPMAEAKTDQKLVLDVHPRYKDNYPRYLQVIRHIAFRENQVAQRVRMQKLHDELLTPETSDRAALQLEAIGKDSIPLLKVGLKSSLAEVRFHSAIALAYLEDPSGLKDLQEAARDERAFRVFALAAMSTVDEAESHLLLRELMNENSAETRYGAFRSLWTLDKNDPFIRGERMSRPESDKTELTRHEKRATWMLHVLETKGEPMVHTTFRTRPEVVLFGMDQKMVAPLVLSAGRGVMITAKAGDPKVSVVRFRPNQEDERREVSMNVADVIRACDELGATYPDVVSMLTQASEQRNLEGRLESDALPQSERVYARPSQESKPGTKVKVGRKHLAPNIFPRTEEESQFKGGDGLQAKAVGSAVDAMANITEAGDAKESKDNKSSEEKSEKKPFWNFWSRSKK
ncbi:MAG TPA: flagellar basal body P-ring protein FlgI [Planctomycetaceae bacterium]|nr:flagellar basal body P-ring protein FlgI [Planctomycetaceae bacterium]